jgi:hypothetical protein
MKGNRIITPSAVQLTMHVYCIRKDGMAKQVLDIDGGTEVPNIVDLQESRLLSKLPDAKDWRLMTAGEVQTFKADIAAEDRERREFMAAVEELQKLHPEELDDILKKSFGWTGMGA